MKVTFICDKLNVERGGSNHSLNLLASRLSRRGHDIRVVTMNFVHENSLPEEYPYSVIEDPVRKESGPTKAAEIYRKLSNYDNDSDILHVFNPAIIPIAGRFRSRQGNTPIVGRLNTYDIFCTNLSRMDSSCFRECTIFQKFTHDDRSTGKKVASTPRYAFDTHALPKFANGMDRFFALSPAVANIYSEIGFEESLIDVVPNSVDPDFGMASSNINLFDYSENTLLYVGRLSEEKGVDLLIDCLDHVRDPSKYRVEIVGDGPGRDRLERHVDEKNYSDRIRFNGWVEHEQLPDYYDCADLFVHPGRWPEPFGRTIIEAMQSGTPVVTSDVGAPPWIVNDDRTVFERSNASSLAQVVDDVLTEPASNFTERYEQQLRQFTPEKVISKVLTGYNKILD